jgi:hypothetical protein
MHLQHSSSYQASVIDTVILVQIWSLIREAGDNFTKNYVKAFSDLLHIPLMCVSLAFITIYTDLH